MKALAGDDDFIAVACDGRPGDRAATGEQQVQGAREGGAGEGEGDGEGASGGGGAEEFVVGPRGRWTRIFGGGDPFFADDDWFTRELMGSLMGVTVTERSVLRGSFFPYDDFGMGAHIGTTARSVDDGAFDCAVKSILGDAYRLEEDAVLHATASLRAEGRNVALKLARSTPHAAVA